MFSDKRKDDEPSWQCLESDALIVPASPDIPVPSWFPSTVRPAAATTVHSVIVSQQHSSQGKVRCAKLRRAYACERLPSLSAILSYQRAKCSASAGGTNVAGALSEASDTDEASLGGSYEEFSSDVLQHGTLEDEILGDPAFMGSVGACGKDAGASQQLPQENSLAEHAYLPLDLDELLRISLRPSPVSGELKTSFFPVVVASSSLKVDTLGSPFTSQRSLVQSARKTLERQSSCGRVQQRVTFFEPSTPTTDSSSTTARIQFQLSEDCFSEFHGGKSAAMEGSLLSTDGVVAAMSCDPLLLRMHSMSSEVSTADSAKALQDCSILDICDILDAEEKPEETDSLLELVGAWTSERYRK